MSNAGGTVATNAAGNAGAAAVNAGGQQPAAQQGAGGGWAVFKSVMSRMVFMFMMMQAMNYFKGKPPAANTNIPVAGLDTKGGGGGGGAVALGGTPGNVFAKGSSLDFYVYLSESELFDSFDDANSLFYSYTGLDYGDWYFGENKDGVLIHDGQISLTQTMQNNGSIYMHVYFTENGRSPNPHDKTHSKRRTFSTYKRLNKYIKKTYKKTKNLLTGSTDKDEDYQLKAKENLVEILSHWHPNITVNLVDDHTPWQSGTVPPPLNEHIEFDKSSGKYYPIVFVNDYWNLLADYYPINDTLTHLNLTLTFSHIQLWKWQLYLSQTMRNQLYGGMFAEESSEEDQDTIKRTLLDTNPYLLAITVVITLVHSVFEFLAFKNDIQFWRNRKSLEGLSVNSVLFGCVTSLIVLLYVLDNDTNTVVRISVGVGLLIDLWKVPKVLHVSLNHENKLLGILPRPVFVHKTSYVETNTNEYDRLAFKYLSWALFPLVVGYSIYSLLYQEHKGWYSWFLSMLYGFLLTFGFIMMTPQLFINYKLKSVAHLPWRMMTYKALNTFIDDIFAFVIKMPTMYRIGCFRDDIIFFIYLYQRWIYRVDKKRLNEFGTSGEMHEPGFVPPPADDTQQEQITEGAAAAQGDDNSSGHPKSE